ncbi:hypothetical protein OG474_21425 [Kribbella sp. NBC_01505]|uniref:hypothetical protein n=1 Tax=Kribbella sp. NBC_01505 TaxID=2903580 RepID=UPI003865BA44
MADDAEEMLKQVRQLARDLDSFRGEPQQARMPRELMEEIRNIRHHNPDVDRALNDRPPPDQYGRLERELRGG